VRKLNWRRLRRKPQATTRVARLADLRHLAPPPTSWPKIAGRLAHLGVIRPAAKNFQVGASGVRGEAARRKEKRLRSRASGGKSAERRFFPRRKSSMPRTGHGRAIILRKGKPRPAGLAATTAAASSPKIGYRSFGVRVSHVWVIRNLERTEPWAARQALQGRVLNSIHRGTAMVGQCPFPPGGGAVSCVNTRAAAVS